VGRRLILDTNILIAYERGTIDRSALDEDELAVAAVTVAEYRVGIELADTATRAARSLPRARRHHLSGRGARLHRHHRSPPRTPDRPHAADRNPPRSA
jgi:predicted nucleic acid-binding protein